jgi:uncharacterized lipoprotein YmbA
VSVRQPRHTTPARAAAMPRARPSAKRVAASCAAAAMLLGACAGSPPVRFHTLQAADLPAAATTTTTDAARFYLDVEPPRLPEQVDRPQFVIDTDAAEVGMLEQQRWSAPLSSEIRQALADDLSRQLGALDVYLTQHPDDRPVYRVATTVRRFASAPGAYARIDATWAVVRIGGAALLTCRSDLREVATGGFDGLVDAHRRVLHRMATGIAGVVRAAASGGAPACPAPE